MIVVHGGAGPKHPDDDARQAQGGCLIAARAGASVLEKGGSALDAVIAAVTVLENDPQFNAGRGSALNADGDVEMDASVMTSDLKAGAVAAVRRVANCAQLARLVMEKTSHVLLAADGAHRFAREQGIALVEPASLITDRARKRLASHGTVGAVARDKNGRLAAATSTGGTTGKRPGRVGDTPLIGCGTYCDDAGAVSCTGVGEAIIKTTLARAAADALRAGRDPSALLASLVKVGGDGGLIWVDSQGRRGFAFNTKRMARAWVGPDGDSGSGFD